MAAPVTWVYAESFPSHIPASQALVSREQFYNFFPDYKDPSSTLLYSHCKSKAGILIRAYLASEEETPRCESPAHSTNKQTLRVFASKSFLKHYRLLKGSKGVVRLFQPLPLSKLVIGARSRHGFKWATSENFSNGLHNLASCQDQAPLVRQGDSLALPLRSLACDNLIQGHHNLSDLFVLESYPVTQGVVTVNTSVVVADCQDISSCQSLNEHLSHSSGHSMPLIASDFAHYANSLGSGDFLLGNASLVNSGFSGFVQALECRVDIKVVDIHSLCQQGAIIFRNGQEPSLDKDSTIFLSKNLLLKLGLFNGEWVIVSKLCATLDRNKSAGSLESTQSPNRSENKAVKPKADQRIASVVVVDFAKGSSSAALSDTVGVISLVHWFNLTDGELLPRGSKSQVKLKRWNPHSSQPGCQLSESSSRSASPQFAKELHIEAVRSPGFNLHSLSDALLHQYFTTPRLLKQGSVISVPTAGHPEVLEACGEGVTRWPFLSFKVKKICGTDGSGPYLADATHSSLYMEGSTSGPVPWVGSNGPSFWTHLSPAGLSSTVEQLVTIIHPYVKESSAVFHGQCSVLLRGPSGCGKVTVTRATCRRLHLHLLKVDCVTLCADTAAACEVKMRTVFQKAEFHKPCVLLLRNFQLLGQPRDGTATDARVLAALCQFIENLPPSVVVVASVSNAKELSSGTLAAFVHQVVMECPTEDQRRAMLGMLSEEITLGKDVNLSKLARQTVGFVLGDLCALVTLAGKQAHKRIVETSFPGGEIISVQQEEDLRASGVSIQDEDFRVALETLQEMHSQALGAPKIPSVRWQDVGGLQQVKRDIMDTIQLPLEHPELAALGLKRSGLLLYGPPGTGKTLLAKAVATECSLTFLSVKGPELLNMYVGQSEDNVREVFSKARAASPCIIFFDELDSLAPNRGRSGDSGGVMDRVVSQLLAELDGLHSTGDVFVIGATNRPDLLDQSLLRPGRFDKLVYVGANDNKDSQLQVLKAITRKFRLEPGVCLEDVVAQTPPQMTGADLYALCSDAMMAAVKRKIERISTGLEEENGDLLISAEDFNQALSNVKPSLSDQELLKYKYIQQNLSMK